MLLINLLMEIPPIQDNTAKHRFEISLSDGDHAFISYQKDASGLALMHTIVPEQWEGKGIAGALVKQVLDKARAESVSILPYCPYVAAWLKRHPDYQDVVAEGFEGGN